MYEFSFTINIEVDDDSLGEEGLFGSKVPASKVSDIERELKSALTDAQMDEVDGLPIDAWEVS